MSALDDVTVLELTTETWSAIGAALLADFGAKVIRIDDLSRPPLDRNRDGAHPREAFDADAELHHRNKRSIGIDLSDPAGRDLLEALVAEADVFLTDLPLATLEAHGWSAERFRSINPGLVCARGSGFGSRGPDRDLPALDELAAARTGVMPTLPQPGEPPVYTGSGQMYTAVMLAFGVMVALHHRAETGGAADGPAATVRGEGQEVDASLFGGNLYGSALNIDAYLAMRDDRLSEPISRLDAGNPMSGASLSYPTSDGRWVTLTMPDSDRWWPGFSKVMGLDVDDPRFDTHDKRCGESRHEMMQVLEGLFSKHPSPYWRQRFDEEQLSADIIEKYDFVTSYAQAALNRYILDLDHPSYGKFQSLGFPIHMSDTPARLGRLAPARGQHSAEILTEMLHMPDSDIADLEVRGVIGSVGIGADPDPGSTTAGPARPDPTSDPTPAGAAPGEAATRKALEGIRVLDLTVWFQGPVCSQYLADFGAEVIHVERPEYGDPARGVRSINAVPVADWNQYFLVVNRNKKSIAVDLKAEAGRDLIHRLVAESDVFLWNQSMSSLEALGLDHQTLAAINPGLVYVTNSGYGHRGSNKPAFDMTVQALTGMMTRLGEPGQPPIYLGLGAGDAFGGLVSSLGIMIALHRRRVTGKGQHVDASLLGSQLFLAAPTLQRFLATGDSFYSDQRSRKNPGNPLWNRYPTKDRWVFLCLENTDDNWTRLGHALDHNALATDERFADADARATNSASLVEALDAVLGTRSAAEWMERFGSAGVTAAPVNDYRDVAVDPQAWANDYFTRAFCGEVNGEVELRGLPVTLSRTPGKVETLGPELGQDTELLLVDVLGCSWDEIGELKAAGAIP